MLEDWQENTLLIWMTKITKKLSKIWGENWKDLFSQMVHIGSTKVAAKQEIAFQKIPKTIYGWKVESHESTRPRVECSPLTIHEDRIAGKGFTSMTYHNVVHKFILLPQAMKIPDAKVAVDKEWKKLETTPRMAFGKSQE